MSKAVVLLSGGQDSTTCLYWAKSRIVGVTEVHALSVNYGQRHLSELQAAFSVARLAGCASHVVVDVDGLFDGSASAMIDRLSANRPGGTDVELSGDGGMVDDKAPNGLPTSFVPGRNLMLLGLAVSRAGALGATHVVVGVCQTDYSGYPDCRADFVAAFQGAVGQAWPSGHAAPIVHVPLMWRTKAETVVLARELPGCWEALAVTVTCYNGQRPGCGTCPSCELRRKGFADAGEVDPSTVRE